MTNISCLYPDRDAVLVSYLYDDTDFGAADRVAFETHVTTCPLCRGELADFRGVRQTLGQWASPEPARAFTSSQSPITDHRPLNTDHRPPAAWWHSVPVWAQVAAAMLVLGVSASIANLDIRYDRSAGLSVRTGWSTPAAVTTTAAAPATTAADAAPWRADLAALQSQLRSEVRAASQSTAAATPAGSSMSDAELLRRVRNLLDESEQKQTKELAVRLSQLQSDVFAQRQADLTKINQNLGYIQSTYGTTYSDLRNYVLKVSQKQ